MPDLKFGDIVLIKFPFTDGKGFKKRPALVIRNSDDGDILVCRITGKKYDTSFDIDLKNWSHYGLKLPSVIRTHKLVTLESDLVEEKLGVIKTVDKNSVKALFKKLPG